MLSRRAQMKNRQKELIEQMTDKDIFIALLITQCFLLTISAIFVIILFKDISTFFSLFQWNDWRIFTYGVTSGLLVVGIDIYLMKNLPKHYYDDGGINEKIFKHRSIGEIAILAAIISICEEIFFRGVIQTNFGIMIASVIFALVHYRYLFHWFLFLNIMLLSFYIGLLYEWTGNLMVTITMHFITDFLLGVLYKRKGGENHGRTDDST
jgi:uncharacterized protein